jgi:hypothetical protein
VFSNKVKNGFIVIGKVLVEIRINLILISQVCLNVFHFIKICFTGITKVIINVGSLFKGFLAIGICTMNLTERIGRKLTITGIAIFAFMLFQIFIQVCKK